MLVAYTDILIEIIVAEAVAQFVIEYKLRVVYFRDRSGRSIRSGSNQRMVIYQLDRKSVV